jgi:hypothetical protein
MNNGPDRPGLRGERRAAPKPARIPPGDRPTYPSDEGLHFYSQSSAPFFHS